jgi:hypothetical protein
LVGCFLQASFPTWLRRAAKNHQVFEQIHWPGCDGLALPAHQPPQVLPIDASAVGATVNTSVLVGAWQPKAKKLELEKSGFQDKPHAKVL